MNDTSAEKELLAPVRLSDERGRLNPAAIGWSRQPLHHCQIKGYWLRKKRWNFWFITAQDAIASLAIIHLDYVGLAFLHAIDLKTGQATDLSVMLPFARGVHLGQTIDSPATFTNSRLSLSFLPEGSIIRIKAVGKLDDGRDLVLSCMITRPDETLNVVIPWGERRFQYTSKQMAMPVNGTMRIGEKEYRWEPKNTFASLDYGRGVWPYQTCWNWATCSFRSEENVIGFNFGSGWTDGTGMTENGMLVNGRLYKLSEQIVFRYDRSNLLAPWQIETANSKRVRLMFTPLYHRSEGRNFGIIRSVLHQLVGRYSGHMETPDGMRQDIANCLGICEEQMARW